MTFDPTKGSQRIALSGLALQRIEAKIPQLRDDRRRRPLYFDGRFLAARDLTREQDYFLSRQADLARAGGAGVVTGLLVTPDPADPGKVRIQPGHGVTPSGELVVLTAQMSFNVSQASVSEAIRVRMGVQRARVPTARVRSGLYVLALRPIEYEANPVAQYPTTLDGERSVHNGDIVEATAVTLIPYPDLGEPTEARFRRAHAAKEIFIDRVNPGLVTDALPIAMVALDDRGTLLWVDSHLVRREVGAEAGDILGVSGTPLALREAFMLQFDDHLRDVLAAQHGGIVAAQHFLALPPAGAMPKSAIDRQLFAQRFFPAEVDVDVSVIPSDELGALLEEARLLPPIDLTDAAELASTSVLVLVPVDREKLNSAVSRLVGIRRKLPAAAPNLLAKKRPLERLAMLPLARQELVTRVPTTNPDDVAWRNVLDLDHADDTIWYVRRRNLSAKPTIVGEVIVRPTNDIRAIVRGLGAYELTDESARLVSPRIWAAVGERVAPLAPLSRAAAIVELGRIAPADDGNDDVLRAHKVVDRFEVDSAPLGEVADGGPAAALLVRSGLVREAIDAAGSLTPEAATAWRAGVAAFTTTRGIGDVAPRAMFDAAGSATSDATLRSAVFAIFSKGSTP